MTYFVSFFVFLSILAVITYMLNIIGSLNKTESPAVKDIVYIVFHSLITAWGLALLIL